MLVTNRRIVFALGLLAVTALAGCGGGEKAFVEFSYVVEPTRGLPPGMKTIIIQPASLGPNTDPKWSDLVAEVMQTLVNEARINYGAEVMVSDRRDTQISFDEADLAAAGMSTGQAGSGGVLDAAQGAILSNINVKVEKHVGKQRTISGLSGSAYGGRHWGGGGGSVRTQEVETVTRNMTVQASFKLLDAGNNRVWEHYTPKTFQGTDKTEASPFFGSSQTEAELTPQDKIIGTLVEKAARQFISRLVPCTIIAEAEVVSSGHEASVNGVKMLRAEMYAEALGNFKMALAENPDDHCSSFGAGVASEATGQYGNALKYYKRACAGAAEPKYVVARDRVKDYGTRVRK